VALSVDLCYNTLDTWGEHRVRQFFNVSDMEGLAAALLPD
jgi:hypothetical protein